MSNLLQQLIPRHYEGKHNDLAHKISLEKTEEAKKKFRECVQKLFDVNSWKAVSDDKTTEFFVTDKEGNVCHRTVQEGDYLKIDLPGPGSTTGEGYDWVRVEKMIKEYTEDENYEGAGFTVRATGNPQNADMETAHFFSPNATSTFLVERRENIIYATYHGRNEKLNKTGNIVDKVRNTLVGAGALAGLSEVKWSDLIRSFLK